MALHPDFPCSPYAILPRESRWFPAVEELRGTAYEKLLPPLVAKVSETVAAWRDRGYAGVSTTSRTLLEWWFATEHLVEQADGTQSPLRYYFYFVQRKAVKTLIWGDNRLALSSLKAGALRQQIEEAGELKPIYIDPPFDLDADFSMDSGPQSKLLLGINVRYTALPLVAALRV